MGAARVDWLPWSDDAFARAKAAELFKALDEVRSGRFATGGMQVLGAALLDTMPNVKTSKGVSRWLRNMRGRVVRGRRIEGRTDKEQNNTTWFVKRV